MDLATLTTLLVRAFLVVTMLSIGLRLADRRSSHAERRPRVIGSLFAANLLLVPLVAVAVTGALGLTGAVALGVVAVAVSPAGSLGPKLVHLARGDLRFGVIAVFLLALVATVTVAPSIAIADGVLGLSATGLSPIDPRVVVTSLVLFQLVPVLTGLAVARRLPSFARRAVGPLTALSTALMVAIIVVAMADTLDELMRLGPAPILAMIAIALAGGAIGWLVDGGDPEARRAAIVITAQRAPALALLVVGGPGHAVETATVAAFSMILLVANTGLAVSLGRGWPEALASRWGRRVAIEH